MDSSELYSLFRASVRDDVQPYLWSDEEVFAFMDDAQKMFCRFSYGIVDSTSTLTTWAVPAGTAFFSYDPRILKLVGARLEDGTELEILNYEDGAIRHRFKLDNRQGKIKYIITNMDSSAVRFVYIPDADTTIRLTIERLPLVPIQFDSQLFEIEEQHHIHLLSWMKYLAYSKHDAETFDPVKALAFQQEFISYCTFAKNEKARRQHKYRSVVYGGL
jgi:hypothetical protein